MASSSTPGWADVEPCGTNGVGEPRYPVDFIKPGSVVRFGLDDDGTALVIANVYVEIRTRLDFRPGRRIVLFGCFGDEPHGWEQGRLFQHDHPTSDSLTVVLPPGV